MILTLTLGPGLDAYTHLQDTRSPLSLCKGIKAPDILSLDIHSFEFFNFLLLSIPIKMHMQYIEDCPASDVIC